MSLWALPPSPVPVPSNNPDQFTLVVYHSWQWWPHIVSKAGRVIFKWHKGSRQKATVIWFWRERFLIAVFCTLWSICVRWVVNLGPQEKLLTHFTWVVGSEVSCVHLHEYGTLMIKKCRKKVTLISDFPIFTGIWCMYKVIYVYVDTVRAPLHLP